MRSLNWNGLSSLLYVFIGIRVYTRDISVLHFSFAFFGMDKRLGRTHANASSMVHEYTWAFVFFFFFACSDLCFHVLPLISHSPHSKLFHFDLWDRTQCGFSSTLLSIGCFAPDRWPRSVPLSLPFHWGQMSGQILMCIYFVFRTSYDFIPKFSTNCAGNVWCCFFIVW